MPITRYGPGDSETWGPCTGHPLDPRTPDYDDYDDEEPEQGEQDDECAE